MVRFEKEKTINNLLVFNMACHTCPGVASPFAPWGGAAAAAGSEGSVAAATRGEGGAAVAAGSEQCNLQVGTRCFSAVSIPPKVAGRSQTPRPVNGAGTDTTGSLPVTLSRVHRTWIVLPRYNDTHGCNAPYVAILILLWHCTL